MPGFGASKLNWLSTQVAVELPLSHPGLWRIGDYDLTLRVRHKEERHVVVVVENAVARSNDGVLGRRIGKADPGLKAAVIGIDDLDRPVSTSQRKP